MENNRKQLTAEDYDCVAYIGRGRLKGKLCYYDDVDLNGRDAVVYLGKWRDGYYMVRISSLFEATKEEEKTFISSGALSDLTAEVKETVGISI
jgi:hypothetical protein